MNLHQSESLPVSMRTAKKTKGRPTNGREGIRIEISSSELRSAERGHQERAQKPSRRRTPTWGTRASRDSRGGWGEEAPEGLLHLFRRAMRSKSLLGGVKQCRTSRLKICKSPRKALPELQRGQEDAKRQFRISELAA